MVSVASALDVGRTVVSEVQEKQVTFLAASISYYAFVSVVPLLLLALAVGTFVGGEQFASYVVDQAQSSLTPAAQDLLGDAITNAAGRGGATVVGSLFLLWSGLKVFRGLDIAFSEVYATGGSNTLVEQVVDALTVLAAIAVAAVAAVLVGGVLPALSFVPFADLIATLVLPLTFALAFLPVYYFFPDIEMPVREALPGAIGVGVGWTLLTGAFRLYAANAGQFQAYGVIGAVLLLVTWFYVAAIVIILGAVLNAVLAGRIDADEEEPVAEREREDEPAPDIVTLEREVRQMRDRLDEKTVSRSELERDLKGYVRQRLRRGHARGWGPYLVLLYGTGMTLGAFFYLRGLWAIFAMFVVWLSTLGMYVLMLLVGAGLGAAGVPGRLLDWVRARGS